MNIARYMRVSTPKQSIERQIRKENEIPYIDKISGSIPFFERPSAIQLKCDIENNEIKEVKVESIDRIGRNLIDIMNVIEYFENKNINLVIENIGLQSINEGTPNYIFKMIVSIMGSIAQAERETILHRQQQGIAIAKLQGKYKGRVKGSVETDEDFLLRYKNVIKYLRKGHSMRDTAKICGVSLGTTQKVKSKI